MKERKKKAIQKGQDWMKKSVNSSHDYKHAENVADHSLEVLRSLREEGWRDISKVDKELALIVAWWHDCYKALHSKKKVYIELFEGIGSARIAKKELGELLSSEDLAQVLSAIRWHNNFPYLLLAGKRLPLLTRALIEADTVDAHFSIRKAKSCEQEKTIMHRILGTILEPILVFLQGIYIKSPYAKIKIREFKKKQYEFKTKSRAEKSSRA